MAKGKVAQYLQANNLWISAIILSTLFNNYVLKCKYKCIWKGLTLSIMQTTFESNAYPKTINTMEGIPFLRTVVTRHNDQTRLFGVSRRDLTKTIKVICWLLNSLWIYIHEETSIVPYYYCYYALWSMLWCHSGTLCISAALILSTLFNNYVLKGKYKCMWLDPVVWCCSLLTRRDMCDNNHKVICWLLISLLIYIYKETF